MPQNIKCVDCKDTSKAKTKTKFYVRQPVCKEISIKAYLSLHNAKKGKCANSEEPQRKNSFRAFLSFRLCLAFRPYNAQFLLNLETLMLSEITDQSEFNTLQETCISS